MSSKRPSASVAEGPTEAEKARRKAKREKDRAAKASEGLLSKNRPGFRGTILTSSMGLAGLQGQTLG